MFRIGGTSLKDACRRIMEAAIDNELCSMYNWSGKRGWRTDSSAQPKKPFSQLLFAGVIKGTSP